MQTAGDNNRINKSIEGCILGTAAGDAIGLPYEGVSRQRGTRMLGEPTRHRLLFGHGMISDDTEHTCMVAQALIASGGDAKKFSRSLAWRFRFWFLGLPAGMGLATGRAIIKLWLGFSPSGSGVFSAGNGPAMRSAILGAAIDDPEQLRQLVRANTRITHTDPKAEFGALAVALAARAAALGEHSPALFLQRAHENFGDRGAELVDFIGQVVSSVNRKESTEAFALSLGFNKGVSGYVYHTVPIAIHAWLSHPHDFRQAIEAAIRCGGDTDTVAAIVGGIVGAGTGRDGIPKAWLDDLCEWPRSISWMTKLATRLTDNVVNGKPTRVLSLQAWAILPRNLFFLAVVLLHGFRRLLPPY